MKGYRIRCTLVTKLVNELVEMADKKQRNKITARYGRVDLFCVDAALAPLGCEPFVLIGWKGQATMGGEVRTCAGEGAHRSS
ncbi:hypothetical protein AQ490_24600 [Wenjunlia vitaminophila]|uniref:Uncharacterized protein n=1 Tax=Wenjunlia vitaminophila TaxID=76728 RepID=A0A0T6LRM9_WENVI|nr:hypothetical protein AQ490_24600 [Wenjunlia vitaminophila]